MLDKKEYLLLVILWISLEIANAQSLCRFAKVITEPFNFSNDNLDQHCKWFFTSPSHTHIDVNCTDISIPCSDGEFNLYSATTSNFNLCRENRSLEYTWQSNKLTVEMLMNQGWGHFNCTVKPVQPRCQCGYSVKKKIVGGEETGVNEFPFMAGLIKYSKPTNEYQRRCGSAIVSKRIVLSAGHCFENVLKEDLRILVGDHNLRDADETDSVTYELETYWIHPDYNKTTLKYDISVIKTTIEIVFDLFVGPVCLPYRFSLPDGDYPVVGIGWGKNYYNGDFSDSLKKVSLMTVPSAKCGASVTKAQICVESTTTSDMCQYDSGGPMVYLDKAANRYMLIGLVSYGIKCATGAPSINTRVAAYLDYLQNVTSDNLGEGFCMMN